MGRALLRGTIGAKLTWYCWDVRLRKGRALMRSALSEKGTMQTRWQHGSVLAQSLSRSITVNKLWSPTTPLCSCTSRYSLLSTSSQPLPPALHKLQQGPLHGPQHAGLPHVCTLKPRNLQAHAGERCALPTPCSGKLTCTAGFLPCPLVFALFRTSSSSPDLFFSGIPWHTYLHCSSPVPLFLPCSALSDTCRHCTSSSPPDLFFSGIPWHAYQ